MAKAERDAMKVVEDEERAKFENPVASDKDDLSKSKLNPKAPVYPRQNLTLTTEPLDPPLNTPSQGLQDKMEFPANHQILLATCLQIHLTHKSRKNQELISFQIPPATYLQIHPSCQSRLSLHFRLTNLKHQSHKSR